MLEGIPKSEINAFIKGVKGELESFGNAKTDFLEVKVYVSCSLSHPNTLTRVRCRIIAFKPVQKGLADIETVEIGFNKSR